ncbi:hypothetical protein Lfu02_54500 [Longispora fulva]|uniref:Putative membrane protein n=1 Tax=Longispora fulva TaxID=619741 RepID=A0A8J7GBR3_9ACTN|nr:DUF6220 domain-containing protein [Longispora fulva]MBG6137568.1 putative membrane protein [Longispora fulva]GIG61078.1 hypothetical protein Lfu02_54500 [Longispora fulva]
MRTTYKVLAILVAVSVALQGAWIAFGVFGLAHDTDDQPVLLDDSYKGNAGWMLHGIGGQIVVPLLAIALLVVAFFAHVPHGVRWAAIIVGLVALQVALGFLSFAWPGLGLLHGFNALVLFGMAIHARQAAGRPAAPLTGPMTVA